MSIIRGIETVDEFSLNLISSAKEVGEAVRHGDRIGAVQGTIEHAKGYVEGTHYLAIGTEKGTMLATLYAKYFPFTVDERIVQLLEKITAVHVVAGIGIVLSSLTIIVNSISIHRQNEVLSCIPNKQELDDDAVLLETVEALEKVNYNHFRKALPDHLKAKIETQYGGPAVFEYFKDEIKDGRPAIAKKIVSEIQEYATKKRIVHILALVGGIVGLIGSIGLLVGFPPLALIILAIVGLTLTITGVLMSKGWVENTKDGFNWKLCFPEFIQKKMNIDKEVVAEFDYVKIHEGITPQLQIMEIGSSPVVEPAQPNQASEVTQKPVEGLTIHDIMAMQGVLRIGTHGLDKLSNSTPAES